MRVVDCLRRPRSYDLFLSMSKGLTFSTPIELLRSSKSGEEMFRWDWVGPSRRFPEAAVLPPVFRRSGRL